MAVTREARAHRRLLLSGFVVLFLLQQVALFWLYWSGGKTLLGDELSYLAWARGFAGLAPMPPDTGWWPPLQAWLLGGLLRLFGENLLVLQLLQTACMIAAAALLRAIWRDCDGRVRAANIASALFLLNPSTMAYAHWLWPEPLHLLLLLAALRLAQRQGRALRQFGAGLALGGALLAKSLLSLFWPLIVLLYWPRLRWRAVLALLLGVALVTAVPLWQGWHLTGKPMIADSSAFNLVGGLTDRLRSDNIDDSVATLAAEYFLAAPTPAARNAVFMARAAAIVREQGVMATLGQQLGKQYFRLFSNKTLLLSQLPGRACAGYVGAYQVAHDWRVELIAISADALHLITLAGFAAGLAFWRRWREPLVWWSGLFFAYQLGLYLLLHVKARFLLPMLPFLCAFAGSALASLARPQQDAAVQWRGGLRAALAALLAALLLGLALAGPWLDKTCA
jgi:hypothetical protein